MVKYKNQHGIFNFYEVSKTEKKIFLIFSGFYEFYFMSNIASKSMIHLMFLAFFFY